MSREALMARLASLKKPEVTPPSVQEEVKEEVKPTPLELLRARQAMANTPAAKAVATADAVKSLVANTNAKVEVKPADAPVDVAALKLIVENVSELTLSAEAKGISGFNPTTFETKLKEINLLQEQSFPEIQGALTVINKDLRQYPELAHLLSPAQIRVIVQRILHEKHAFIAPPKKAKAASKNTNMLADLKKQIEFEGDSDEELSADDL